MRAQYACLLLAALSVTLAAGQSAVEDACAETGYFDGFGVCQAGNSGSTASLQLCPAGCAKFLEDMPEVCKSYMATVLTPDAASLLNHLCGSDLEGNKPPSSDDRNIPTGDCLTYFESTEYFEGATDCATALQQSSSACPASCTSWFRNIPSNCVHYLVQDMSDNDLNFMERYCGIEWQRGSPLPNEPSPSPSPSPDQPSPSQEEPSPSPGEVSPSPTPEEPSPSPSPEPNQPRDNTNSFTCTGDYSWVPLDANKASQWGEIYPETGAHAALARNCSYLYLDEDKTLSGCCSETRVDLFPWWQYDLGTAMQVKGVRLTPPHDEDCCLDELCIVTGACYNRLAEASVSVGNSSLPKYYASQDYQRLLTSADGNERLAQAWVLAAFQLGSTICNQVEAKDLVDADNKVVDSVNIGCETGSVIDSAPTSIKGRYVTIGLTSAAFQSLALCGIEICAKTA